MSEFTITLNADALLRQLDPANIDAAVDRAGDKAAIALEGAVKSNMASFVRTGRLRNSIAWKRSGKWRWSVGTDVSYARPVDEGSRPHIIRPKNPGGVLAWPASRTATGRPAKGSSMIFAREVHHPGFKGYHFLERTIAAEGTKIRQTFEDEIVKAITGRP